LWTLCHHYSFQNKGIAFFSVAIMFSFPVVFPMSIISKSATYKNSSLTELTLSLAFQSYYSSEKASGS
jgi:hypothetical protein